MADVTIREYQSEDAPMLAKMFNEMECAGGGHPAFAVDQIRTLVRGLVRDIRRDSRMIFAADGALVAAGLVTSPPDGGVRAHLWGGVDPAHRGEGIGRQLLGWQLRRADEIHRATAPDAEWQAESNAIVGDRASERMLERFGLTPMRYYVEMVADTRQPSSPPPPPGIRSSRYRPELDWALHAAHTEAFSDHWGSEKRPFEAWAQITVGADNFRPDLSWVALDGQEIAGYVLSYNDADRDRVNIGHVGTRRRWRRRGVASALIGETLSAAQQAGIQGASLGVDADSPTGAVGVYERAGFTVAYRWARYHIPLR